MGSVIQAGGSLGSGSGPFGTGGSGSFNVGGGSGGASSLLGLGDLVAILAVIMGIIVVLGVVGVFVIVVVANRAEPDPSGRRPQSVAFFAISFVTLLTSVIGSAAVVSGLVSLIGGHPATPSSGPNAFGNTVARTCVLGALITVISVALLVVHLRRGLTLARAGSEPTSPVRRVGQSYVAAVTFVFVLVVLVAAVATIYLICAVIGPGVFGSAGGRVPAARSLIEVAYVGVVAAVIVLTHRNLVPPGLRMWGRPDGPVAPDAPAAATVGS